MAHAVFRIRGKEDLFLIVKKKKGEITKTDVANTVAEALGDISIWAADIEDLKQVVGVEEIREIFRIVKKGNKFFM